MAYTEFILWGKLDVEKHMRLPFKTVHVFIVCSLQFYSFPQVYAFDSRGRAQSAMSFRDSMFNTCSRVHESNAWDHPFFCCKIFLLL